jgi:hypothetical protein
MFEQLETWTKTRKSNKESRGRLLSPLGRMRSCSASSPVTGSVSVSQIQSVFKLFIYFFGLLLYYPIQSGTEESY